MIGWMMLLGGLGAVTRFVVDAELRARTTSALPLATWLINLAGSLLLGVLAGLVAHGAPAQLKLVLGTGFCGGFTTFSTAMVESVRLVRSGRAAAALGYLLATALGCLALAATGYLLV